MSQYDEDIVPPVLRRAIAVYEAARVMLGYITPGYDEVSQARAANNTGFRVLAFGASVRMGRQVTLCARAAAQRQGACDWGRVSSAWGRVSSTQQIRLIVHCLISTR